MKISTKLQASLGTVLGLSLLMGGMGWLNQRRLSDELVIATDKTAVKIQALESMRASTWELIAHRRGVFIGHALQNQSQVRTEEEGVFAAVGQVRQRISEVRPLLVTEEGRRAIQRADSAVSDYEQQVRQYLDHLRAGRAAEATALESTIETKGREIDSASVEVISIQRRLLNEARTDAESVATWGNISLTLFLVLLVVVGAIVAAIVRSINAALTSSVAQLGEGARQVASAATQVSGSAQSLSQSASEQAASLEETSASVQEIHSMTRRNAENSKSVSGQAAAAEHSIHGTNQAMGELSESMNAIVESSSKISKIIKVIDEIAFQTNILALNAAVEAARAGEAGMGFAVVADEVRNLAQRSAQAAKDTTQLIEESIHRSQEGKARLEQVASAATAVTDNTTQMKTLAEEVNLGSEEQARGIDQITKAISQMERVTQQVAANAEEGAAAGEELAAQASQVESIVHKLERMVGGGSERAAVSEFAKERRVASPVAALQSRAAKSFPLDDDGFRDF